LSKDLWEGDRQRPLTLNPYLYALAHPTDYLDPTGSVVRRNEIPQGFQYSCRCGWIDWGHAGPGAAYNLIEKVKAEPAEGKDHTVIKVGLVEGPRTYHREYVIHKEKDNGQAEWSMALSVFKDLSEQFEGWQDHGQGFETSFSEEDLPSNLIGFYIAMYEHMGLFQNPDPQISVAEQQFVRSACDCVDHFVDSPYGWRSQKVFDVYDGAWRKVHDWNNAHLDFDDGCWIPQFCSTSFIGRSWPGTFRSVPTVPKGRELGYFWEYDKSIDGKKGKKIRDNVWLLKDD
jgi:hypothetical protein